jgi:hypothetical protein
VGNDDTSHKRNSVFDSCVITKNQRFHISATLPVSTPVPSGLGFLVDEFVGEQFMRGQGRIVALVV